MQQNMDFKKDHVSNGLNELFSQYNGLFSILNERHFLEIYDFCFFFAGNIQFCFEIKNLDSRSA